MLDVSPSIAADILGDRLPSRVARSYRRFRHGPGAFKVDFAVEEGVPWTAPAARHAGTVHLGGDLDEVVANEEAVHRGAMPERPFVLVGQQYLADPTRSVGNIHPVWTYAHVPHAYAGDATEAIIAQIERFAPGFRERIIGTAVRSTTEMSVYNAELRRWRHHRRSVVAGTASVQTTIRRRPVLHRRARYVSVLSVNTARGGSTRNVRRQRRRPRPATALSIGQLDRAIVH